MRKSFARTQPLFEDLEARQLLSAGHGKHMLQPNLQITPGTLVKSASPSVVIVPPTQGFTPTQIRHAYGFDQIGQDGTGQTIAIIDAFNNPQIVQDLAVFDAQFGLPAINLTIVNQNGGKVLPTLEDDNWAGETALDVEWAHAIAPGAHILLVETRDASNANLMAGVQWARYQPGVSAVSMSWGGVSRIAETAQELQDNLTFTTPAGHQGITFVASSGDTVDTLVSFPGSSANVLSVGGTTLTLNAGAYGSETSWNQGFPGGSTGGFSDVQGVPYYQTPVTSSTAFLGDMGIPRRAVPDVSYDANPNTGFAIYDAQSAGSIARGWYEVGGTSAGAPQWAALVTLANQARVQQGKTTLDGFSQTLPALYGKYGAPGTTAYNTTYTTTFHDVNDGTTLNVLNPATPGYDTITGLGTPIVPSVVQALLTATTANTTPVQPVGQPAASPAFVTATITSAMPIASVTGGTNKLKLLLTNVTNGKYKGPVTINVFTSTQSTLPNGSTPIATVVLKKVSLNAGRSKKVTIQFQFPNNLGAGDYFFFVTTDTSAVSTPA
jgi:subtilase family serine protease